MTDMILPTVKVKSKDHPKRAFVIINKADFDESKHEELKDDEPAAADPADPKADISKSNLTQNGRNPSGTFSEPTPSDIRYNDKDSTEFENNHRSGRSAAELRDDLNLEDKPGGIHPEDHEDIQAATAALKKATKHNEARGGFARRGATAKNAAQQQANDAAGEELDDENADDADNGKDGDDDKDQGKE